MKPKRIILVRHGESEGNVDKNVYGNIPDYTLELTKQGINQALNAGKQIKEEIKEESVFFYISPFWRTRSTFEQIAKPFAPNQFKYIEEPRIREQEWGHLRTLEVSNEIQKARDGYGTFYYRLPDGESAADVFDRVSDFLGTLHRDFEKNDFPENVIIVSHGMTIRLFLMRWFHWTVEEFELLANPENCEIITLEKQVNGKYLVKNELKKYENTYHRFQRPINLNKK